MIRVLLAAALFLLPVKALAEEESKESLYAPDFCEFEVTFPEDPYTSRRCNDDGGECHDLVSYTQVFDMASTVNFRVICNEVDESVYESYSDAVMEATLRAMTKKTVVKEFNSHVRQGNGYKQAALVGEGKTGRTPMIYIAQLWIGQKSALTVEAELIGEAHDTADQLFSDVLRSIRPIAERPEETDETTESADKSKE